MSKALEALCYLDDIANGRKMSLDPHKLNLIVEKELKALEIIKKKNVLILALKEASSVEEYNYWYEFNEEYPSLTKKEFELLKEVLE